MKTLRSLSLALVFLAGGLLGPTAPAYANNGTSNYYLYLGNYYMAFADYYAKLGYAYNAYYYANIAKSRYYTGYYYSTNSTIDSYAYSAYANAHYAQYYWYLAYYYGGGLNYSYYGYYGNLYSRDALAKGTYASYLTAYY